MDESLSQNSATERAYLVFEPRRAISSIRSWARRHAAELMCAGLLAGMSWQMLAVISRKSITIDEIVMIPAAYYHLVAGDFQLVNEHPPLAICFFLWRYIVTGWRRACVAPAGWVLQPL